MNLPLFQVASVSDHIHPSKPKAIKSLPPANRTSTQAKDFNYKAEIGRNLRKVRIPAPMALRSRPGVDGGELEEQPKAGEGK